MIYSALQCGRNCCKECASYQSPELENGQHSGKQLICVKCADEGAEIPKDWKEGEFKKLHSEKPWYKALRNGAKASHEDHGSQLILTPPSKKSKTAQTPSGTSPTGSSIKYCCKDAS